jgi:hypothetical protein
MMKEGSKALRRRKGLNKVQEM